MRNKIAIVGAVLILALCMVAYSLKSHARMGVLGMSGGVTSAPAAPTLLDSYTDLVGLDWEWMLSGTRTRACQSFNNPTAAVLYSAKFYMYKTGSPTGNAYATLWAHSGTYGTSSVGTGTVLATSDAIATSAITTSAAWYEFVFTGAQKYSLAGTNTKYVICAEYTGGTTGNYLRVGCDWSQAHLGNYAWYSGSWHAESTGDTLFYLYVD